MSLLVKSFAALESGAQLQPFEYALAAPQGHEVLLEVTHCGICHSDLHLIDDDWGISQYPLVPGHEVVGTVLKVGEAVQRLKIGMRVGVGWQAGACLECGSCVSGQENLCTELVATCADRYGGFASHLLLDSRFAFALPEKLSSESAAPLLCGGVTVYSPLQHYGVRHWHRVGVVGIGGLGHLALRFARAMGCEVTAFSSSASKEDQAKELGAHHFVHTRQEKWYRQVRGKLDFILVCATADLDWMEYLKALAVNGKLCFVTGEDSELRVPVGALVDEQKSISGSVIGGRAVMREMLDFATRHGIDAMTEVAKMSSVNAALDKVRNNEARYRMVLES